MASWSKVTLSNDEDVRALIREARGMRGKPEDFGVFRTRVGFALIYSPSAPAMIDPATGLSLVECGRPDEMAVEVVVGAYDDPAWYDGGLEPLTEDDWDHFYLLRGLGFIEPDADIEEMRRPAKRRVQ
jgi:hypothetical protein